MNRLEEQGRRAWIYAIGDDGAKWAFRIAMAVSAVIFYVVGRHQSFTHDDWAYVLSRDAVRTTAGWQHWLFDAQDGHWLTIPVLIFHFTREIFGLGSYWPFLLPTIAAHVGAVLLTRQICRRLRVSAWNTTLVCSMLLVFGSGWDNIVFAIQICYNLSLVLFLAQVLLVDHTGPVDRRDVIGALLGVLSVMSSGFGPIFMVGVFVMLVLRRRWKAMVIAVVPQAIAYAWWLLVWATDPAADARPGDKAQLPAYVVRGITATFESVVAIPALAGVAVLATLGIALWSGNSASARSSMIAMWATVGTMFLAIGWERIGFGVATAASSRYLHVAAIVIAPAFALAVDQLARITEGARWAGRAVVAVALAVNAGSLRSYSSEWALESRREKDIFELVAGSPEVATADLTRVLSPTSPNVTVLWLARLQQWHAITARAPANEAEHQRVLVALGLSPPP